MVLRPRFLRWRGNLVIASDVILGKDVRIPQENLVNLYGCEIGSETRIGAFVEIQRGVKIGRRCKIQPYAFICTGVTIGDGVFIGPGVVFCNDIRPRAITVDGDIQTPLDWTVLETVVEDGVSIGANATILPVIRIGKGAAVGAGAIVVDDVPAGGVVCSSKATIVGDRNW